MSLLLSWLRHLLLFVPALGTLLAGEVESQGWFVLNVLIGLLLIRIGEIRQSIGGWLLPVELVWFGYLGFHEGGLMYLLLYSSLAAAFSRYSKNGAIAMFVLAGGVMLNVVIQNNQGPAVLWSANILWCAMAAVLYMTLHATARHHHVESLYDELAHSHEQLEQARRRLQDYTGQIEQFAQAEERNRIAKDIHDDLGHRLIRQKMMLEAALQLLDTQPERAHAMLRQIRDQMEDGMERMRQTVRRLSPSDDSHSRRYALDRLIATSGLELGLDVTFTVEGIPQLLYPSIEYVLFRNAQEAITNAVRHGGAKQVNIILDYRPYELALTVTNDGAVPGEPLHHGLGLRGMEERIAMLGGRLEVQTSPAFTITTILPIKKRGIHH
ncbi:sensor histidine kinase [Paenibacillus oenotherae]|uniref:histidine kinase n=1 Tax=Paenibacillus oenotherae TaxID=1435645 RepID=A0ABS7D2E1_9BACL|nr:sensor histidine kinase [Paenibacillus oenotherae]MBW7473586.1 sensor histidine kinase [Paenibacillus oenotherae]